MRPRDSREPKLLDLSTVCTYLNGVWWRTIHPDEAQDLAYTVIHYVRKSAEEIPEDRTGRVSTASGDERPDDCSRPRDISDIG